MIRSTWLGHSAVRIEWDDTVVYVDPVDLKPDKNPPADLILLTNGKPGHASPEDIAMLATENTIVAGPREAMSAVGRSKRVLDPGDVLEDLGPRILAVPSGTRQTSFFPGGLGYHLEWPDARIYVAGMTDHVPVGLTADAAFLPISGRYVMDLEGARRAGEVLGAEHLLPLLVVGDRFYRTKGFVTSVVLPG